MLIGRRWPTTPPGGGGQKAGIEGSVRTSDGAQGRGPHSAAAGCGTLNSLEALVTTPDQLRDIVSYLQNRVQLDAENPRMVVFDPPDADTMVADGLDSDATRSIVAAPWWPEMVDDVVDTPEFCAPSDSTDVILGYARDVVQEYIWKRFDLSS
jgi:hypothetical protein